MIPRPFPQQTIVLESPDSSDVQPLPIHWDRATGVAISCWVPTEEERAQIAAGEPVWLGIFGEAHPPVFLTVDSPFITPEPS